MKAEQRERLLQLAAAAHEIAEPLLAVEEDEGVYWDFAATQIEIACENENANWKFVNCHVDYALQLMQGQHRKPWRLADGPTAEQQEAENREAAMAAKAARESRRAS
jgi:hypothetical protein